MVYGVVGYDSPNQYTALLNRMIKSGTNCRILRACSVGTVPLRSATVFTAKRVFFPF